MNSDDLRCVACETDFLKGGLLIASQRFYLLQTQRNFILSLLYFINYLLFLNGLSHPHYEVLHQDQHQSKILYLITHSLFFECLTLSNNIRTDHRCLVHENRYFPVFKVLLFNSFVNTLNSFEVLFLSENSYPYPCLE